MQGLPEGYDDSISVIKERQAINQYKEKEIEKNYQKYLLTECPAQEIKQKQISSEKHKEMLRKTGEAVALVLGAGATAVIGMDVICHPEYYFTTMAEFQGASSFSDFIGRIPGDVIQMADGAVQMVDTIANTFRGRWKIG